ncbi:MAG: nucleoside kinase [Anaerostipes sp.]|nr:nucleoside kinase [Anaerostipes sp.]
MLTITIGEKTIQVKKGTPLETLAKEYQKPEEPIILLGYVNQKLRELSYELKEDSTIKFVTNELQSGYMTYKRTTIFILLKACEDVLGEDAVNKMYINYSIGNSSFCEFRSIQINDEIVSQIDDRMRQLIENDLPINKMNWSTQEVRDYFAKNHMEDKERLFQYRKASNANLYELDGYYNYFYGYMVPSTGYIKHFLLNEYENGMILQIPRRNSYSEITKFTPQPKLFSVMQRSRKWCKAMKVETVGDLNDAIVNEEIGNLILVQEALQERVLSDVSDRIIKEGKKFVLISGPSSSGKTTFSHRLSIQLQTHGMTPHPISLDDYFLDRELSPKEADGSYNFESIYSLNLKQFNEDMSRLLKGETVQLPTYNFITGKSEYKGNYKTIGEQDILVIEGIHGLNSKLSSQVEEDSKFKIYVSALSQINMDQHNRIPSSDGRLIRRIVRDSMHRGTNARDTIRRWDSVRQGEEENIFPYQEEADIMFNSAQVYELAVLKQYAEPLLFAVSPECEEYQEAKRLLKFFDYFLNVRSGDIPQTSLLREFIGGSCFET